MGARQHQVRGVKKIIESGDLEINLFIATTPHSGIAQSVSHQPGLARTGLAWWEPLPSTPGQIPDWPTLQERVKLLSVVLRDGLVDRLAPW